jgi:hypothetical protein
MTKSLKMPPIRDLSEGMTNGSPVVSSREAEGGIDQFELMTRTSG